MSNANKKEKPHKDEIIENYKNQIFKLKEELNILRRDCHCKPKPVPTKEEQEKKEQKKLFNKQQQEAKKITMEEARKEVENKKRQQDELIFNLQKENLNLTEILSKKN